MDNVILGRNIHRARRDLFLSSDKLSEMCDITPSYLRQVEAGSKTPSLPLFVSLCEHLKVSPSFLLAGVVSEPVNQSYEELSALCKDATPKQLALITALIKTSLKYCE